MSPEELITSKMTRIRKTSRTSGFLVLVLGLSVLRRIDATLNPDGTKCGQKMCSTIEYCSPFDSQCKPCADICERSNHNFQPEICVKDCQEYLHDQRYVLRVDLSSYEDLTDEVHRLKTLLSITLTLTCVAILAIMYLVGKAYFKWKTIKSACQRTFANKKWIKKATSKNKIRDDVETGVAKQNGLKLAMPTISATVAPPQVTGNNNGSSSSSSRNSSGSTNASKETPNTSSTPLSRRHPSEDTTLDYAYDNPAMTPSPDTVQLKTKRESSF
ncbi:protein grindelwald [Prorops nasuta]|uniref:protein grindelwald n=1 Tax=Prorops nasuta TaxID=863751 RepID=UPI0034CD59D3